MSWNLLAYAVPLFGGIKTLSLFHPAAYLKYEQMPKSPRSELVSKLAEKIFHAEMQAGGKYQERIKEMLQDLPDSITPKDIKALVVRDKNSWSNF